MKGNLILIALIMLTAASCNQKAQKQEEKAQPTPLTEAEKRQIEVQDSLKLIERDSLALIAWGDAKFGMSMKQVRTTEAFRNSNRYNNDIDISIERIHYFAEAAGLTNLYSICAQFKENELIKIRIGSHNLIAKQINRLSRDCDIFIDNFKKKYGEPSFKKDKINISEFNEAEEIEYARFNIGTKKITILLKRMTLYDTYHYLIDIDNDQFPKKKRTPTEKEIKETEKYLKELKEVKKNSF